jgi:hypothetical protein
MENNMSKLVPVARRNATVFVRSDLVVSMIIVGTSLNVLMTDGNTVTERFDSVSEASEAAVRICNACNEGK